MQRGFTFIEVLLVIAIIGLIGGLAIPFYQSFQVSSQLDDTTQAVVQALRRAQAEAMASVGYESAGVHFEQNRFVVFRGKEFNSSDPFNENTEAPRTLSIQAEVKDLIFTRVRGTSLTPGTIVMKDNIGGSRTITVNEEGAVDVL